MNEIRTTQSRGNEFADAVRAALQAAYTAGYSTAKFVHNPTQEVHDLAESMNRDNDLAAEATKVMWDLFYDYVGQLATTSQAGM